MILICRNSYKYERLLIRKYERKNIHITIKRFLTQIMHNCHQKQYYTQDGSQIKINSNIAIFFHQIHTNQQTNEQEKPKWLPPYKDNML